MIPLFKRLVKAMLWDELAARRWMRGMLLACSAGGIAFADQLAALLEDPELVRTIKIVALVCGFLGGALTAGQLNHPAVIETETQPPIPTSER